jgi:tetratricopeptide (TPR) repeat protein
MSKLKRFDEALKSYDRALVLDKSKTLVTEILTEKGAILLELGRYSESLKTFEDGIKINSTDALLWYNKAQSLNAMDRYSEALKSFAKSLKLDGNNALAWYNKGYAELSLGKVDQAFKDLKKAISLDLKLWIFLKADDRFDSIKTDKRYLSLEESVTNTLVRSLSEKEI